MRNWSARAEEINDLLIERKNTTNKDMIQCIDDAIHRYIIKERKERREEERMCKSRSYEVVNWGWSDDDWSGWEKRLYLGAYWSEAEKQDFIDSEWEYINSPYDCTGQMFTQGIDVFNVPAGVVVYIFSAIDC